MQQKVLESKTKQNTTESETPQIEADRTLEVDFSNGMDEISKYSNYGLKIRKIARSAVPKKLKDLQRLPKKDTFEENIPTRIQKSGSLRSSGPKGPKIKLQFFKPLEKERSFVSNSHLQTPGSSVLYPTKPDDNIAEVSLSECESKVVPYNITMKKFVNTNNSNSFKRMIAHHNYTGESEFINNFRDSESIELSKEKKKEMKQMVKMDTLGILKPSTRSIKLSFKKSKKTLSSVRQEDAGKSCFAKSGEEEGDEFKGISKKVSFNRRVIVMEYHPKGRLHGCSKEKKKKRKKTRMNLQKYFNL